MTKRNPTDKAKHRAGPKTAAKTQRVAEAVVRSPKDRSQRSAETAAAAFLREEGAEDAAGSTSGPAAPDRPEVRAAQDQHNEQYPLVDDSMTALQQEVRPEPSTALQNDRLNNPTTGIDFSSATGNVRALQAKLGEVAQANMQFTFEFAQRLAAARSPLEFFSVTAEFTSKRSAMFLKHSTEIAGLSMGLRTAL